MTRPARRAQVKGRAQEPLQAQAQARAQVKGQARGPLPALAPLQERRPAVVSRLARAPRSVSRPQRLQARKP